MMPSSELDVEQKEIASGILKLDKWYEYPPTKNPVDPQIVCDLLDSLKPYHIDQDPAKWVSLGILEFELRNGKKYAISLYDPGSGQAAFSIDRTYYRGGSNRKLTAIVDSIRKSGNGQKWIEE
ncbi:MAG: hypothetical protein JXM70_04230 [Pirellulales bacterium]|nr:hypothetical protein [Pirellulales bacterium]